MPPPAIFLQVQLQMAPGSAAGLGSQLQRELQGSLRNVDLGVSPTAVANVGRANRELAVTETRLRGVGSASAQATPSMRAFGTATLDASGFLENLGQAAGLAARRF